MVRWDSPLFTVLWEEDDAPVDDIWKAVTAGNVKAPHAGTQVVAKAPMDALHTLEQTTTSLVSSIMSEQASSSSLGGPTTLTISATLKPRITLPARNITLSELQRCKRQFVTVRKKAITLGSTEKGAVDWGEESVAGKFVDYLEENLKP
jgi:protein KTI12